MRVIRQLALFLRVGIGRENDIIENIILGLLRVTTTDFPPPSFLALKGL